LAFFAIPIVMIGYSSIQAITFQNGTVTIQKTTEQLQAAPTDATVRSNLANQVASLASRPTADPTALASIAGAQFALGNRTDAEATLQKAMQTAPALPQVVALKQRMDTDSALTTLTAQLAQHPNDTTTKQKLADTVAQAAPLKIANPGFLAHLSIAHAALGDKAKAKSFADAALKIKPDLAEATQLKSLAAGPAAHN